MYRLVISLLLLCSVVVAQPIEKVESIRGFRGLNTRSNEFALQPNDAIQAHNIDWSRALGSITKRYGYTSLGYVGDCDSLVGIYGAYFSDGTQRMVYVTDPDSTDYGAVMISQPGELVGIGGFTVYDSVMMQRPNAADSAVYYIIYNTDTVKYRIGKDIPTDWGDTIETQIYDGLIDSVNTNLTGITCSTVTADSIYLVKYDTANAEQTASYACSLWESGQGWYVNPTLTYHAELGTTRIYNNLTTVNTKFSVQNEPSFAMLNDNIYIVNGDQAGLVVDGERGITRPLPMYAPGQVRITPYLDSSDANYYLNGQYRYALVVSYTFDAITRSAQIGYVSAPVNVDHGRVLLDKFPAMQSDSLADSVTTITVAIYRTLANPGALDERDLGYLVGTINAVTDTGLANTFWVDSLSDDMADDSTSIALMNDDLIGRDSLGAYTANRYGAPSFDSTGAIITYSLPADSAANAGIYYGIPTQAETLGVVYACTFIDTALGIESDTGRSLAIWVDTIARSGADKPQAYTIRLPKIPDNDTGIVINVYRGLIQQVTYDSSYWSYANYDPRSGMAIGRVWVDYLAVDTIMIRDLFLVGQVPSSETTFTDNVRYDSLSNKQRYRKATAPVLSGIFSYGDRLWGWNGSNLYFSLLDSANSWGGFDFISINKNDGDQIVTAYPVRGVIRVHKNKSTYNVYQDGSGLWNLSEVSGNYGCIAPESHAAGPVHYFLSNDNVLGETEGGQLERVYQSAKISAPIDNIDKLSMPARRKAVGLLWNEHYLLSIGDTTYVWDEKAQGWSTWSLPIADYTYYGTESATEFIPGDTLYFIKPGDSTIYRYGTSESDNGVTITLLWRSGPVLSGCIDRYKQITTVGLAVNSSDASSSLYVLGYRHDDSSAFLTTFSDLTARYTLNGLPLKYGGSQYATNEGLYYNIALGATATATLGDTEIDGIDIWYTTGRRATVK